jgi:glucose/arabinose dehydrogenase
MTQVQAPSPVANLTLPAGFQASVFAEGVVNARSMALGPKGTVFVGSRTGDKVHAVVDQNGDHRADKVVVIASGLNQPNGIAMRGGALYVATAEAILRYDDIEQRLDSPPAPVTVRGDLPSSRGGHSWKFIAFGPDDLLYVSVGSPCNVCTSPPMVSTILRMKPDGTDLEMFAEGIRNSVGFDWHPVTGEMWFSENGRDGMGDDVPGDELNIAPKPGMHFGFPFCHQGDVPDPQFGAQRACSTTVPPALTLGAHVAALGVAFYTGSMFPAEYTNTVFVAEHGSWNRSTPSGYRVMVGHTDGRRVTRYEPFLDGFLPSTAQVSGRGAFSAASGRPVDVLQMTDGSLLISDDSGNRLIRVSYARPEPTAQGQRVYEAYCANCHGSRAEGAVNAGIEISIIAERGGKQPPDLTDAVWDHGSTDTEVSAVIKQGLPQAMMPAYEGQLSDADIQSVVSYIRTQATTAPQQTLEVADYAALPVTGDPQSTNLIAGQLARGSILRDEPGGRRFFVNDLNGPLYILNKDTKQVTTYLNFDGAGDRGGLFPQFTAARGFAAGLMNFVFDPEYTRNGIFYTLHMEDPNTPAQSAVPKAGAVPGLDLVGYTTSAPLTTPVAGNPMGAREMVIVEWTDRNIANTTFEGTAREVLRMELPGLFHPLNELIFNPTARPGDPDWRVMYLGVGDSGTGERQGPMRLHAQRLDTLHGKILRIIPMLSEHQSTSTVSANGRYRIPDDNPFVSVEGARKEIWALGLRNPHRLTWYVDPARPREATLFAFNIGLVSWETVVVIKKGANYGYPLREGAQTMSATNGMGALPEDDVIPVQVTDTVTRGTVRPTYPVIAYPHNPTGGDAIANGFVYRGKRIPALQDTMVFGDITTGRIWYAQMKDVLAADDGNPLTFAPLRELTTHLRALSEEAFKRRGGQGANLPGFGAIAGRGRVDIRLAEDDAGELYILTKGDGMIREIRSVK